MLGNNLKKFFKIFKKSFKIVLTDCNIGGIIIYVVRQEQNK